MTDKSQSENVFPSSSARAFVYTPLLYNLALYFSICALLPDLVIILIRLNINTYDKNALKEAVFDDIMDQLQDVPIDHSDLLADILKEVSNHNEWVEESEEWKGDLLELLKITREDNLGVWEEHFKSILLLLLETLGDKDHSIRALALQVLRESLWNQPASFKNYAELTIMKTLEARKDSHKVIRAAEEAASTLAISIHPKQCIKVLCPIIQTADYPINLAATRLQMKVIKRISKESLHQLLPDIILGLLQGYDNMENSVRKTSVFFLVAIYSVIGEELKPHLAQLTGNKMKLLDLYIKKTQITNSNSTSSSDVLTHSLWRSVEICVDFEAINSASQRPFCYSSLAHSISLRRSCRYLLQSVY
ncbi:CLIP-associating protein 1-B-like [Anomalospiza imberbis]|uniref:CLIP-associating protein 1-B-like n=1 Tax=Anomalospiza imberbis TaxID=187417 RepID=UPI00358F0D02